MQRIEWVKKLADFIETTLPNVCSMDELSQYIGISKAHMQRQFKLATGLSIGQYINQRRLSRAAIEIATSNKRIIDVAMDYDFESQEAFSRAFRKQLGITPKNLKNHPALAHKLSTIQLTDKYLLLFPELQKIKPKIVTMEPLQLHGVRQYYNKFQPDIATDFDNNLDKMWEKFQKVTHDWPSQARRYFTVECRNACFADNGGFTMMAMCTGQPQADPELISFTLPQQQMLCFPLNHTDDAIELATYLYSVYLPNSNLHINRLPILWESLENGGLHCNISVEKWQSSTPPIALTCLDEQLFSLPNLKGTANHQQIPFVKQQAFQRLEYLFDYWIDELESLQLDNKNSGKLLLIGDALDNALTPEFEFHSHLLEIGKNHDAQMTMRLPAFHYLRARLTGTVIEIADAIDYIKYCALPELPFYSVHGYEIILKATALQEQRYEVVLLLPVKKR